MKFFPTHLLALIAPLAKSGAVIAESASLLAGYSAIFCILCTRSMHTETQVTSHFLP